MSGQAEIDALPWLSSFPTRSREAEVLCELIRESQELLYIDNQYLAPLESTDLSVLRALGERLVRAMRHQERFFVIIVTNLDHIHSGQSMPFTLIRHLYRALAALKRYVADRDMPPQKLQDHVAFVSLQHDSTPIFIHLQVLIQDGRKAILSAANVIDHSLSVEDADRGLGVCLDDPEFATDLLQRLVAKHLGRNELNQPLEAEGIFELVKQNQGQVAMLAPEPGGLHRDLWFRSITLWAPSLP